MFAKMNCEGKSVDIDVHVYFAPTKKGVERSLLCATARAAPNL